MTNKTHNKTCIDFFFYTKFTQYKQQFFSKLAHSIWAENKICTSTTTRNYHSFFTINQNIFFREKFFAQNNSWNNCTNILSSYQSKVLNNPRKLQYLTPEYWERDGFLNGIKSIREEHSKDILKPLDCEVHVQSWSLYLSSFFFCQLPPTFPSAQLLSLHQIRHHPCLWNQNSCSSSRNEVRKRDSPSTSITRIRLQVLVSDTELQWVGQRVYIQLHPARWNQNIFIIKASPDKWNASSSSQGMLHYQQDRCSNPTPAISIRLSS